MARIAMLVWNEFLNDARVLKEAQTLSKAGHQVLVYALHTPGKTLVREKIEPGIEVFRVARSPLSRLRGKNKTVKVASVNNTGMVSNSFAPHRQFFLLAARALTHAGLCWRLIRSRADVVHAHDVNVLSTAWLAAKCLGVPLVYDAHEISTDREGYKLFRNFVGWIEKKIMPAAAASITTTDMRAKFFARAYNVPRPLVLQNRPRRLPPIESSRLREILELKESWPLVLYQGGLQSGRGLDRMVEAAASVNKAYFVFVGGGNMEAPLKALVKELNLEGRVFFIPTISLNELPFYTASADIGVQPIENTCLNHFTTDSNKLFEYVQAGLPVVASALPEIAGIVRDYNVGLLVKPGDSEELADAIRTLVEDTQLRQSFSENSRVAAADLNWEKQESALLDLYQRVLS